MKLRYLLIVGVLVFLNGFVFTVLLLMLSRELALTAATPTEVSTPLPTMRPTFTSIPVGPSPTSTPETTATTPPEPTVTSTLVVAPATATYTNTPVPPTATTAPATATHTPGGPTATSAPPTATATAQSTATPRPNWEFEYVSNSMRTSPNCAGPYFKGVILGQGGTRTNGIAVHFWFYDVPDCKVSGEGESTGEWGFNPSLAEPLKNTHIEFYLQVVDNCTNLAPRSEVLTIPFDKACDAGQFEDITFRYAR